MCVCVCVFVFWDGVGGGGEKMVVSSGRHGGQQGVYSIITYPQLCVPVSLSQPNSSPLLSDMATRAPPTTPTPFLLYLYSQKATPHPWRRGLRGQQERQVGCPLVYRVVAMLFVLDAAVSAAAAALSLLYPVPSIIDNNRLKTLSPPPYPHTSSTPSD